MGEALASEPEGTADEAVRVTLRIMEERAALANKMADDGPFDGRDSLTAQKVISELNRRSVGKLPDGYGVSTTCFMGKVDPPIEKPLDHANGGMRVT